MGLLEDQAELAAGRAEEALCGQLDGRRGRDRDEAVEDAPADEAHGLGPRAVEPHHVGEDEGCGQGGDGQRHEERRHEREV